MYMFNGRFDNKHERGTGFIVHDRISQNIPIIDSKPISDKICLLTVTLA